MTTSALPAPRPSQGMTYARARLWLGISGVGTAVVAAVALLAFDIPARVLPGTAQQPLAEALPALLAIFGLCVLLFLPFDVVGGALLVRARPSVSAFLARWARGVLVQLVVWTLAAALFLTAARTAGPVALMGAFVALQVTLALLRVPLARAIAGFARVEMPPRLRTLAREAGIDPARILLLRSGDEGFVGGWTGMLARTLVLPARWLELSDAALLAVLRRRRAIAVSGAHRRGVLAAMAWNTMGFALVLALSCADAATAAGLVTLAAGMTLWAFVGVLVLPTPSRAAVFAMDAAGVHGGDPAALGDAIEGLDRWQDDEASRPAGVETVFHPVPSRTARLTRLRAVHGGAQAAAVTHHLARHALWLGWGTLSPLSRLVHCNVGRPALWAMLPGD